MVGGLRVTLWSLCSWAVLGICVAIWLPMMAIVWLVTAPFDKGRYWTGFLFRKLAVVHQRLTPLWHFRVTGTLPDDPRRPYVVVSNHESFVDILLISHLPWEMKWLSKVEMFKIPVVGWLMRMAGDVPVTRGTADSAVEALRQCRDRLDKRVSVMVFPEGTRSDDGRAAAVQGRGVQAGHRGGDARPAPGRRRDGHRAAQAQLATRGQHRRGARARADLHGGAHPGRRGHAEGAGPRPHRRGAEGAPRRGRLLTPVGPPAARSGWRHTVLRRAPAGAARSGRRPGHAGRGRSRDGRPVRPAVRGRLPPLARLTPGSAWRSTPTSGVEVALVLAGPWLDGATGSELLREVRHLHPHAMRSLLIAWGDWGQKATGEAIFDGIAQGHFDSYVLRPAAHPTSCSTRRSPGLLLDWAESQRAAPYTVHIVGESWSGRAYELREALRQCAIAHNFCLADSAQGRELVAAAGDGRDAADHRVPRRDGPGEPVQRRDRRRRRLTRQPRDDGLRRRHRRRRACGPLGGRVRRVRGLRPRSWSTRAASAARPPPAR